MHKSLIGGTKQSFVQTKHLTLAFENNIRRKTVHIPLVVNLTENPMLVDHGLILAAQRCVQVDGPREQHAVASISVAHQSPPVSNSPRFEDFPHNNPLLNMQLSRQAVELKIGSCSQ